MNSKELVRLWFESWRNGEYNSIPVTDDFKHTSPYGTINGKAEYLRLVEENKDKFLGYRFEIHDELYEDDIASVRYTAIQEEFKLEVSEWHFVKDGLIKEIVSYYNIDTQERPLSGT